MPTTVTISAETMHALRYVNEGDLNRDTCMVLDPSINPYKVDDGIDHSPAEVRNAVGRLTGFFEWLLPRLSCLGLAGRVYEGDFTFNDKAWASYATPFIPRRRGAGLLAAAIMGYLEACPEELTELILALAYCSETFNRWLGKFHLMPRWFGLTFNEDPSPDNDSNSLPEAPDSQGV